MVAGIPMLGLEAESRELVGVKFFLIKHVAIFDEAKYTQGWLSLMKQNIRRDGIHSTMPNLTRHQAIRSVTPSFVTGNVLHF
jgi:hypothetical protein